MKSWTWIVVPAVHACGPETTVITASRSLAVQTFPAEKVEMQAAACSMPGAAKPSARAEATLRNAAAFIAI